MRPLLQVLPVTRSLSDFYPIYRRRYVIHVLRGKTPSREKLSNDLDLWPGDEVWDSEFNMLGMVNAYGLLVTGGW